MVAANSSDMFELNLDEVIYPLPKIKEMIERYKNESEAVFVNQTGEGQMR